MAQPNAPPDPFAGMDEVFDEAPLPDASHGAAGDAHAAKERISTDKVARSTFAFFAAGLASHEVISPTKALAAMDCHLHP